MPSLPKGVLVLAGRSLWVGARRAWTARRPLGGVTVAGLVLLAGSAAPEASAAQPAMRPAFGGSSVPIADPIADPIAGAGPRGRELLRQTPTAAELAAALGHPASTPVRVYVGLQAAADPAGRARLAVRELDRAGAFRRPVVLVAIPTGSGWVNPSAPATLEQLYAGDVATVAVQYSAVPSWLAYVQGIDQVRAGARALLHAVHERALREPAGRRPRVLIYGESLGVIGGVAALRGAGDPCTADGALWVGPPAAVRDQAAAPSPGGRQLAIFHRDDPVPVWSPDLLWRPAPGWHRPWLPLVSFWTSLADMVSVYWVPVGHGHRYGGELRDAWLRVASPTGLASAPHPMVIM